MRTLGISLTLINDCDSWSPSFPGKVEEMTSALPTPLWAPKTMYLRDVSGYFECSTLFMQLEWEKTDIPCTCKKHTDVGEKLEVGICLHSTIKHLVKEPLLAANTLTPGLSKQFLWVSEVLCIGLLLLLKNRQSFSSAPAHLTIPLPGVQSQLGFPLPLHLSYVDFFLQDFADNKYLIWIMWPPLFLFTFFLARNSSSNIHINALTLDEETGYAFSQLSLHLYQEHPWKFQAR